ncbi:MAG: protein kinase [Chloroflexota bacterium]
MSNSENKGSSEQPVLNGRYRLLNRIGSGGMSIVYKAQDLALGRLVAVKLLHSSLTDDSRFITRFQQEAKAAASLTHPNIVTIHDVGHDGDKHYIVMELVEGSNLKSIIRKRAPLELDETLDLTTQICEGTGYAHRAGFVHCDIKPQNVLVTEDGIAKVTDFGIARAVSEATATESDVAWGTPHYFSPEQASGTAATPASDVYAIGVMLHELLTGELPFVADSPAALALKHINEEPPWPSDVNPSIPVSISRIVSKIMSKESSSRYRTANQLGRILRAYQSSIDQNRSDLDTIEKVLQPPPLVSSEGASFPNSTGDEKEDIAVIEPAGVGADWLVIFLMAIAILAILGLIPLWVMVWQAFS